MRFTYRMSKIISSFDFGSNKSVDNILDKRVVENVYGIFGEIVLRV